MTRMAQLTATVIFAMLALAPLAAADMPQTINYQGRLTNPGGAPLDTTVSMIFVIYDDSTAGTAKWMETQAAVSVSDGLFHVILGSINPIPDSVFTGENRYLGIQVGADPEIAPRTELTSAPGAAIAGRVIGDVETGEGFLKVKSSDGYTAVSIHSEAKASATYMTMFNPDPEYYDQPLVEMSTQSDGGSIEFFPAGDNPHDPAVRMGLDPSPFGPGVLEFFDPSGSLPHDPYVRMGFDPSPFAGGKLEFFDPGSGWPDDPMIRMGIEPSPFHAASFRMYNPEIGPPPKLVELNINDSTGEWGSHFNMYAIDPVDEKKILSISSTPSTGASLKMFNPQPEPPLPILEMNVEETIGPSAQWGGYFSMYSMDPGDDGREIFEISNTLSNGASLRMFNPQPEPPARIMEMSTTESAGQWRGYFDMYSMDPGDDGAMNFEISNTLTDGANLKLFNALPGKQSFTAVDVYYDSTNGGGIVKCQSDADNSWSTLTGRDFSLGQGFATNVYINYGGSAIFAGNLGLGVFPPSNILHVQQNSATDPIADAWTTYSSRRWKKNIKPIEGALDKVKKLRGVTFDWKADDRHDIGMIAEEVGQVLPEIVAYEDNQTDAKSIDYGRLTALLVEAVKQQQKTIDQLQSQVETLLAQQNGSDEAKAELSMNK